MRKTKILTITKTGVDYGIEVPAGTSGNDIEIGLAAAFKLLAEHEQHINPNFKVDTLLEKVRMWIECEKQEQ